MLGLGLSITKGNKKNFRPKNMVAYNSITWAEWTKGGLRVAKNSTGIELTSLNATTTWAGIPTSFKPSTKYGMLYNVVDCNLIDIFRTLTGAFDYKALPKGAGNNKIVLTSNTTITDNSLQFYTLATETTDNKIKFKDVRVFELPINSQIETDFNVLTADQLNIKYPF